MTNTPTRQTEFGSQIRKSPYFAATQRWGAEGYSVYNHMYIPRSFGDPQANFWNLVNDAILCDVAVERQVEITGPDAAKSPALKVASSMILSCYVWVKITSGCH